MTSDQITYLIFGIVVICALVFDLGLMSKKDTKITIRKALYQTYFWVGLALGFFVFVWIKYGQTSGFEYLSAYLMEWSLSIDNIFVFILIFSAFSVQEKNYGRVLLLGILMAIVFRIIFITAGVALVEKFHWILYLFGVFLIITGYKMFTETDDKAFDPHESKVYKVLRKFLPLVPHDGDGKFYFLENGKRVYTTLFVVVVMLAVIDLIFAMDSIPAVMGITRDKMIIYTSNIFALLGLRSLFFLLRGAVTKFDYLQQGIAVVLVFIGVKMLAEHWINQHLDKTLQVLISLGVIMLCIAGSIFYSIFITKQGLPTEYDDDSN
ncbi:MAG TPA: TerC/Alx family metal homeostasis membrane protein [Saprospiraceae bacterium]|nr:TerC/Alx family metal homeostasis membrane protein [Saprospiraceae bacterium]